MAAVGLADSYRVSDRRSTQQIGDREVRERFAERVDRPVNGAAFVTPIAVGASGWCGELASPAQWLSLIGA